MLERSSHLKNLSISLIKIIMDAEQEEEHVSRRQPLESAHARVPPSSSARFVRLNPRFDRQETLDLLQVGLPSRNIIL